MKGSNSRLLQVVVAAMVVNVAPDGRAETYDFRPISATYPDDYWGADEDYFDADYNNWEFNDYSEPSDSGNDEAECDAIAAKVPGTCDLSNPPLLVTNGCGSGVSTNLVPDYLWVGGLALMAYGPIFAGACDVHDHCYGTYPGDKGACDLKLNTDMIEGARSAFTFREWMLYKPYVVAQAYAYSAGLQAPFISSISTTAFNAAQVEGACRFYAAKANETGCLD